MQECLLYGAVPIIDNGLNGAYPADFPVPPAFRVPEGDADAVGVAVERAILEYPTSLQELNPEWAEWRRRIMAHRDSFEESVKAYFKPAVHVVVVPAVRITDEVDGREGSKATEEEVLGMITAVSTWLAMPGATIGRIYSI
jgi:hypothetical protein